MILRKIEVATENREIERKNKLTINFGDSYGVYIVDPNIYSIEDYCDIPYILHSISLLTSGIEFDLTLDDIYDSITELTIILQEGELTRSSYNAVFSSDDNSIFSELVTRDGKLSLYLDKDEISIGNEFKGNENDQDNLLDFYLRDRENYNRSILFRYSNVIKESVSKYLFEKLKIINLDRLMRSYKDNSSIIRFLNNTFTPSILQKSRKLEEELFKGTIDSIDQDYNIICNDYKLKITEQGSGFITMIFLAPLIFNAIEEEQTLIISSYLHSFHPLLFKDFVKTINRIIQENRKEAKIIFLASDSQ